MEWKEVRLGDVCSELSDGLHKAPKFIEKGEYIFVNAKNLYNGYILDNDPTKKTSREEYLKYKKPLGKHTILYSIDGTIGNIARYRGEKCVLGKGACYLNCNPQIVESSYLYYQLQGPHFKSYIHLMSTGSTIKHISLKTMREYVFELPSLTDQRRIASILSSLDRKIELNNKINADLEEMAQAIFKNWFVDFEPFKDGKFVDSELGMIPEGWKVGGLFDIAEIFDKKRKPLSGNVREKMDKIYPYYGATSCMDYVDDYIFDGIYTLIGEDGSVVKENGLPYMQYVWGKMWVNNHAHILQGKNGYSTEMIHALLSITNIKFLVTGAVQAKLSQGNMQKILVAIPPKNVLEEIRPVIDNLYSKIRINTDENSRLSLLRDTLLPRLMSGELEVPE